MNIKKQLIIKCAVLLTGLLTCMVCWVPQSMAVATVDFKPIAVDTFDAIVLDGNMTLVLTSASANTTDHTVHITKPTDQQYSISVKNNVLIINQTTPWWKNVGSATMTVDVGQLKNITVKDAASIKADNFNNGALSIVADTSGTIDLNGKIDLIELATKGPGDIKIAWVDSTHLILDSYGSGLIQLSGNVDQLQARLSNHTVLDAQYLRAKVVTVQTTDYAKALVEPINSLQAYAHDYSNIFYYKDPKHFSHFNTESGNVLQMNW